jgi:predicted nucleic acid-binding protein
MRVALDTNVIVSAFRSRAGASAAILSMVGSGQFEIVMSVTLALEYEAVLKRFSESVLTADDVEDLVAFLCVNSLRCEVPARVQPLTNGLDDEFLAALAVVSSCDCLVTHNIRHLAPLSSHGVRVVTPGQFMAIMRGQGQS